MKKNLQAHARAYAQLMAELFKEKKLAGQLITASRGARYLSLGVRLTNPNRISNALDLSEPLALAARVDAVLVQRVRGLIIYQFELQHHFWQSYTRQEVNGLEVGFAEQRQPVEFSFNDAPHALFAGATDSGKTEAIKSALVGLLQTYPPDRLRLIIIDQKNIMKQFANVAHLDLPVAVQTDDARAALAQAHQVLTQRIRAGDTRVPKLALVIDEVSLLPKDQSIERLKDLAKLGREYNVHLLIGNQRATQSSLPEILDNLNNRFIGKVDNAQTSALLSGVSGLGAHRLTGKGDFIHVAGGVTNRFQVAMATEQDYTRLERAEIPPATVPAEDILDLIELPEPQAPGRPKTEAQPKELAFYIHRGQYLSIAQAAELGYAKSKHNFYKQFVTEFVAELKRLKGVPAAQSAGDEL